MIKSIKIYFTRKTKKKNLEAIFHFRMMILNHKNYLKHNTFRESEVKASKLIQPINVIKHCQKHFSLEKLL